MQNKGRGCEMCGNKRRALAESSKHYKDSYDGWRMGSPMVVCWRCEND